MQKFNFHSISLSVLLPIISAVLEVRLRWGLLRRFGRMTFADQTLHLSRLLYPLPPDGVDACRRPGG
jgi:hypothetical protein